MKLTKAEVKLILSAFDTHIEELENQCSYIRYEYDMPLTKRELMADKKRQAEIKKIDKLCVKLYKLIGI